MAHLLSSNEKLVVRKWTTNFREAVEIVHEKMCEPNENEVCVKNSYVGLNADDVSITRGRYFFGDLNSVPPDQIERDVGFEGVGVVQSVGHSVKRLKPGDNVAYFTQKYNAYAKYTCIPATHVFKVPAIKPEYLVLVVSGLTASVGLDKAGYIKKGETVLITAAAGGLGHMAVQWAKLAGCHVIATCSTQEKCAFLKGLGCDRVIDYKKENLSKVLENEYPNGVNVVWETVGGEILEICLKHLAIRGRLIIAGGTSGYQSENMEAWPRIDISNFPEIVWFTSKAIQGYNMENYSEHFESYFHRLLQMLDSGKIKVKHATRSSSEKFEGLEGIIKGIEFIHSGKSMGKVIVKID